MRAGTSGGQWERSSPRLSLTIRCRTGRHVVISTSWALSFALISENDRSSCLQLLELLNEKTCSVDGGGAYVSYDGQHDYRFSLGGKSVWHHTTCCEGGGGSNSVLHGGRA